MSGKKNELNISSFVNSLISSPEFSNYSLRSQFFSRKLRELRFLTIIEEVKKLLPVCNLFSWKDTEKFGIDKLALKKIKDLKIEPLLFFLHPRILNEQPKLLLYYRCIAMLSQKGLSMLAGGNISGIETGRVNRLSQLQIAKMCIAINKILSIIALTFIDLKQRYLEIFLYSSAGSQIQGSWNNAIGKQGERSIKEVVLTHIKDEIQQIVFKNDKSVLISEISFEDLLNESNNIKVLRLKYGFHCIFSSEPDISFRDINEKPFVAVEVKAGTDPAGALERLGAAMKSFEHEKGINPRLKTVYIASCVTPEVQKRIQQNNPFDYIFLLGELISDQSTQLRFVNLFISEIVKYSHQ